MIIKRKLFSTPKGTEETKRQKEKRKNSAENIVLTGLGTGGIVGLSVGDSKAIRVSSKADKIKDRLTEGYKKDMRVADDWIRKTAPNVRPQDQQRYLEYVKNKINERDGKYLSDLKRVNKVANKKVVEAINKNAAKGAIIGTAVSAPVAIYANKKIKENNEKLNAKRRKLK